MVSFVFSTQLYSREITGNGYVIYASSCILVRACLPPKVFNGAAVAPINSIVVEASIVCIDAKDEPCKVVLFPTCNKCNARIFGGGWLSGRNPCGSLG